MTNEEAKEFLDNLKICINEHPIVADWLVEIADRKTEPTISKMEQVEGEPTTQMKTQNSNLTFEKADEPQTIAEDINRRVEMGKKEWNARHIEDEPKTEDTCQDCVNKTDCPWG